MWQYISSSFMASQYCYSMEMTRAMERHRQGKARVIPVLLRPVLFTGAPFAMLKMLPTNGKPVANWRNRDSAFVDIALGIERVVREEATKSTLSGQGQQSPPSQPWGAQMQPITPGGHQAGWPVPSPPRRRRGVLVSLTLVGLSLLLGIVVAGILFTLFSLHGQPQFSFHRRRAAGDTSRYSPHNFMAKNHSGPAAREGDRRSRAAATGRSPQVSVDYAYDGIYERSRAAATGRSPQARTRGS